jgi:tellurite resistance protein TerC
VIDPTLWPWIGFNLLILALLALDLGVFHRKAHAVSPREATIWSVIWISLALLFNVGVFFFMGQQAGIEWFTGYVIEKSLSVDNIFVFVLIFSAFAVPAMYQHRVLFWGILGALVMRMVFILLGAYLLKQFHWIIFVFGGLLIITGIRMAFGPEKEVDVENNIGVRIARRFFPVTSQYYGTKFFVVLDGIRHATPLFLTLVVVEVSDLIFAVDSIPAIFAVTQDPFIVYTSNVFAILGLRSLYFLLAGVMDRFHYLKYGLAVILVFVGTKMLLTDIRPIPIGFSLLFIGSVLVISVVVSLLRPPHPVAEQEPPRAGTADDADEHR